MGKFESEGLVLNQEPLPFECAIDENKQLTRGIGIVWRILMAATPSEAVST